MKRELFEKAAGVSEGEMMPCVSPLGYPAKKMSVREAMMRRGVKADSRIAFGELFFDGSFGKPLTESAAGSLKDILEAVRLAPSAVNKQPWRAVVCEGKAHFYEKRTRGYVAENGWDLQLIDMGIALCHFEAAAEECGLGVSFEIADPGLSGQGDMQYVATYSI